MTRPLPQGGSIIRQLGTKFPGAFTYVTDRHGIIYYSHGCVNPSDNNEVRVTAVYFPGSAKGQDERQSWHTGQKYFKFIFAGLVEERPFLTLLPQGYREVLKRRLRIDTQTQDHFLALAVADIEHEFSTLPVHQTQVHLMERGAPEEVGRAVVTAIENLSEAGVPESAIGVYGGLQCSISRTDALIHDVDLVIHGNEYQPAIVQHCLEQRFFWSPEPRVVRSALFSNYERRRTRLTQSTVSRGSGRLIIDVRTIPVAGEHAAAECLGNSNWSEAYHIEFEGVVANAVASLSLPSCYVVQPSAGGRAIHVASPHHHIIGCARVGDRVDVRGVMGRDGVVRILSENAHGMFPLSDDA